jgi:MgtC family protein
VIIRADASRQVHGLTTAACVWLTACIGAVCGAGNWPIVMVGIPLVFILLVGGGALDEALRGRWQRRDDGDRASRRRCPYGDGGHARAVKPHDGLNRDALCSRTRSPAERPSSQ